jgi:hypothetical protein
MVRHDHLRAHNPKVAGSNPAPATQEKPGDMKYLSKESPGSLRRALAGARVASARLPRDRKLALTRESGLTPATDALLVAVASASRATTSRTRSTK